MRAAVLASAVVGRLTGALFPDYCVLCGAAAETRGLCTRCLLDLPRIRNACGRCAVPLPRGGECADCARRPPPFVAARAALSWAFPVDAALKALKFRRRLHYVPAFAGLLAPLLAESFPGVDALVPVPLHRWRHATRGFNQARELCRPLGRTTGLPIDRQVRRIRRTPPQAGLDAAARRRNLRGAFAVSGRLRCRHPLIIDDVMTTGETCRQLAAVLLDAGADTVSVLTVARTATPLQEPVSRATPRAGAAREPIPGARSTAGRP
ncbi:MAG TPA: ComF family protein [Woeseiaceae bacterium]|nr:ComF family protein [Woeseiaceae bacterium]